MGWTRERRLCSEAVLEAGSARGGGFKNSKVRGHWVDNGGLERSSTLSPDLCTSQVKSRAERSEFSL